MRLTCPVKWILPLLAGGEGRLRSSHSQCRHCQHDEYSLGLPGHTWPSAPAALPTPSEPGATLGSVDIGAVPCATTLPKAARSLGHGPYQPARPAHSRCSEPARPLPEQAGSPPPRKGAWTTWCNPRGVGVEQGEYLGLQQGQMDTHPSTKITPVAAPSPTGKEHSTANSMATGPTEKPNSPSSEQVAARARVCPCSWDTWEQRNGRQTGGGGGSQNWTWLHGTWGTGQENPSHPGATLAGRGWA